MNYIKIPTNRIIGLTTDPIKLNEIRQERLKALGLSNTATYANVDRILEELEYADKNYEKTAVSNYKCFQQGC